MSNRIVTAGLATAVFFSAGAAWSADSSAQQWQDQEAWTNFTEKEQCGGFKTSPAHRVLKKDVTPVYGGNGEPLTPARPQSYVLMPKPQQHAVPNVAPGWIARPGYYYPPRPWNYSFGLMSRRPINVQAVPSKPSGNYYNAPTPDPSASGSYFASPADIPVAVPVLEQQQPQKSYWGRTGSPLPEDMQPK